jgi:hypothetical protein
MRIGTLLAECVVGRDGLRFTEVPILAPVQTTCRRRKDRQEGLVFWWFQRGGKYLRYETRETNGTFELRVISPDGSERVETFTDSSDLTRRQLAFERDLATDGWTGPHGWNL